jgi:hypothetical protein
LINELDYQKNKRGPGEEVMAIEEMEKQAV